MHDVRALLDRNPSADPTPLDWASFYVEELKYGPGVGRVEGVTVEEVAGQLDVLLREAGVTSMSGQELYDAFVYYAGSTARAYGMPVLLAGSVFIDGLMHGIALASGLRADHRGARRQGAR